MHRKPTRKPSAATLKLITRIGNYTTPSSRTIPPLGHFQCIVLVAIDVLGEDAAGVDIATWINNMFPNRKEVTPAQVYGAIDAFLSERLIKPIDRERVKGTTGRPRIVYALTPRGRIMMRFVDELSKATEKEENPHVAQETSNSAAERRTPRHVQ